MWKTKVGVTIDSAIRQDAFIADAHTCSLREYVYYICNQNAVL